MANSKHLFFDNTFIKNSLTLQTTKTKKTCQSKTLELK